MAEELSKLPPQVQERLLRLQQLKQTLQSIMTQKQQVELETSEIDQALTEVQQLTDEAIFYKAAGSLMIRAERTKITTELNERKELLKTRVNVLARQEERLRGQLKEVETRLQQDLQPNSQTSQP